MHPRLLALLLLLCLTMTDRVHAQDDGAAFAAAYTAAWNSQDPANVADFFASGGSLTVNDRDPLTGREAITDFAREFMTAFPDMELSLDGLEERGGRVIYRWRFRGTNTGPDGTGLKVDFSGFEVWQLGADGLIANSKGYFDADDYARQLEHGINKER